MSQLLKIAEVAVEVIYPGGTDDNNFIRGTYQYQSGNTTVTVLSDNSSYRSRQYIRPGMILRKTGVGFTDNLTTIVSVAADQNSFVVADAPTANLSTGTSVIRLAKGMGFVDSGSLSIPTNWQPTWNYNSVTGSSDSEFDGDNYSKWAIYTPLAQTGSESTKVNAAYGVYEIHEITDRLSNSLASYFITSSVSYPEPDGFTIQKLDNSSVAISELSFSESIAQLFHGGDLGVGEGLGFTAAADQVISFIEKKATFPFSGSARITGSLGVTGSTEILKGEGDDNFFLIKSGSFTALKFTGSGVAVFGEFSSLPTAVEGGIVYSASNFYAGIE